MTGTASAFGVEFDSLADVVSFGDGAGRPLRSRGACAVRPGRLGGRLRLRLGGGDRLARFNIQTNAPTRTSATSSACRARPPPACPRRRSSRIPDFVAGWPSSLLALPMVLVPAFLMVSTDPVSQLQVVRPRHAALVSRPAAHGAGHRRDRHAPADHAGRGRLRLPGVRPDRVDVAASPRSGARADPAPVAALDSEHGASRRAGPPSPCESGPRSRFASAARRTGSAIVTVVPTPRFDVTAIGPAVQLDVALGDASGPGRCRSPWSRNTARRCAPRPRRPCRRRYPRRDSTTRRRPRRRAATVSVPPPGIACSAFSMMLVTARRHSIRSIITGGTSGRRRARSAADNPA